jgi:hypothetical protein
MFAAIAGTSEFLYLPIKDTLGLDLVRRDEQLVSAAMSVLRVADIFVTLPPLA